MGVVVETRGHADAPRRCRGGPARPARHLDDRAGAGAPEPRRRGRGRRGPGPGRAHPASRGQTPATLATIIYTSGTTGRPKGCELTHGNFLAEVFSAIDFLPELFEDEDAATLLFLPLAHVFGRMIQVAVLLAGVRTGHSDIARIAKDLPAFQPTFVLAVPRVFERIYDTAQRKAAAGGKERIFALATDTAIAYSQALERGRPGLLLRTRRAVFDRLVYGKVKAAFGGQLRWAVSGGAPLGARLGHFFRGVGVTVLEGYGLTETTAATTVNTRAGTRVGTVGRPLPGFEVRIADDGVIHVRGGHVFSGYWRNPVATAAALDADGWFDTGDLGSFEDGYLTITGRAKEILVTSSGKNVSPAPLEDVIRGHAWSARPWSWVTRGRPSARWSPSTPSRSRPGCTTTTARRPRSPTSSTTRRCSRTCRPPSTPRTRPSPRPRASSGSGSCRSTSPRPAVT